VSIGLRAENAPTTADIPGAPGRPSVHRRWRVSLGEGRLTGDHLTLTLEGCDSEDTVDRRTAGSGWPAAGHRVLEEVREAPVGRPATSTPAMPNDQYDAGAVVEVRVERTVRKSKRNLLSSPLRR